MYRLIKYRHVVALLVVGGAISLFSCGKSQTVVEKKSNENMMTESSDTLTIIMSDNGRPSYRFEAPLVEGYGMSREPYREFRRGVKITTYHNDSLMNVDAVITANYAIYYDKRKLWEAKGDVVVNRDEGQDVYTQQLFWNAQTKRIYSNVDTKIVDNRTGDTYFGEGFESDEDMKDWKFRKMKGRMNFDVSPTERDSTDSTTVTRQSKSAKSNTKEEEIKSLPKVTARQSQPNRGHGIPTSRQQSSSSHSRPLSRPMNGVNSPAQSIEGSEIMRQRHATPQSITPMQGRERMVHSEIKDGEENL